MKKQITLQDLNPECVQAILVILADLSETAIDDFKKEQEISR